MADNLRDAGSFDALQQRISPICKRTLRRQFEAYVKYTKRIPLPREFSPGEDEARLYGLVSEYLQRDSHYALPNSQRRVNAAIANIRSGRWRHDKINPC